jgi:hypothetical protein
MTLFKELIINTGEEKSEGILPLEIPEVLFKILPFGELQVIQSPLTSNNDLQQAIEFVTPSPTTPDFT